ncbi:MAG: hypothetical protein ACREHG_10645 [Candidatus Saccharimonadales bacterium]
MQEQSYLMQMSVHDRLKTLQDTSDKIEETSYLKSLSPEELDVKRESFTENAIKVSQFQDELQEIKDRYKEQIKPLSDANKTLLEEIKTKHELVHGKVYHVANFDSGFMETFDDRGELIGTRRLRPDEKQANLFVQK